MRSIAAIAVLAIALPAAAVPVGPVALADQGPWLDARDAQRIGRERERRGLIPIAIECRHDPDERDALVKPQVRLRWAVNDEQKLWRFKMTGRSRANDLLRAAYRQQGFDLVSRDTFETGQTDQAWMCEIWHKPRD